MSYASAIARANEIRQRLGIDTSSRNIVHGNFDIALQSAQNRFAAGPRQIQTLTETAAVEQDLMSGNGTFGTTNGGGTGAGGSVGNLIGVSSARYSLPKAVVSAIAKAESNYNPNAKSPAGALGVMQLMPATAQGLGVKDPLNAAQNIDGGAKYLRQMLDRYKGDYTKALAAYNAGPGNVDKYGGVPPFQETQAYVAKVLKYASELGWRP